MTVAIRLAGIQPRAAELLATALVTGDDSGRLHNARLVSVGEGWDAEIRVQADGMLMDGVVLAALRVRRELREPLERVAIASATVAQQSAMAV